VLNAEGEVEMDAVVMEGRNLKAGAVACVQNITHPVQLARLVMEKVPQFLKKKSFRSCHPFDLVYMYIQS
jgi:isoaspartyl peptidase/L-asparaginase-like protein (Ntn-hydrolase superfamily)